MSPRSGRGRAIRKKEPLDHFLGAMGTLADLQMVERVQDRYGVSKSDAIRMLLRAGGETHDPSPPSKETTTDDQRD